MKRWTTVRIGGWTMAAIGVVAVGCGGDGEAGGAGGNPSGAILSAMLAEGGTTALPPALEVPLAELGFDLGAATAPISVIEFSDYGCGFCRRFHTETFPGLRRDYIDAGRVRWKYVTYVSGMFANGLPAAFAAECAGEQELFTPVSNDLYERQSEWKSLGDPFAFFQTLATEAGADADRFTSCLTEARPEDRVRSGVVAGRTLGVRGTPSFVINGVLPVMGAQPREYWDTVFTSIEAEIDRIEAGVGAGRIEPPKPHP